MSASGHHIMIRPGDARAEVDAALRDLAVSPEDAGLHKVIHVTRADQTVVFLTGPDAPLACALRPRPGWQEPAG
jgi:hypothetical protein